jgi:hypothetical protein
MAFALPTRCPFSRVPAKPRLGESPMVDGGESLLYPEVRRQLSRGDAATMWNFETRFPRHKLDFCPPNRTEEHETFLQTRKTCAAAEAEEPCVAYDRTRLLQNLSAESRLPGLIALGTATRPTPPVFHHC